MLKRLLRSETGAALAAWVLAAYIRFVWATSRWRWVGREHGERLVAQRRVWLGCVWHGRMAMMAMAWPREMPVNLLSSMSRDGRLGARVSNRFGVRTVFGSTSRGGVAGFKLLTEKLRAGEWAAMTPDGPRGPRMRAESGAVLIAKLAGVPIVPGSFSSTRGRRLASWDGMFVPYPFGAGVFVAGEPIEVPPDADAATLEAIRREVEAALTRVQDEADRLCGRPQVEPAPERARRGAG